MRRTLAFCTVGAAALLSKSARADKFSETIDISLGPRGGWLELDQPLEPECELCPDALVAAEPRVVGTGQLWGGVGRLGASLDGWRFGIGIGLMGAAHLRLATSPLPDGLAVEAGRLWGSVFEGYFGYAIGEASSVQMIMELRGGLTILQTHLGVGDADDGPGYTIAHNAYLPNLDLRLGVRVPLDVWAFVEAGVAVSPLPEDLVPERGSIWAALGLPIPLAHL